VLVDLEHGGVRPPRGMPNEDVRKVRRNLHQRTAATCTTHIAFVTILKHTYAFIRPPYEDDLRGHEVRHSTAGLQLLML
jgi:hypothetical protein